MPRSTREWAQRKLEESIGNIDWAKNHLAEVGQRYEETHPEISGPILTVIEALMEIDHAIEQIRLSF